jgi:hypothetical protein
MGNKCTKRIDTEKGENLLDKSKHYRNHGNNHKEYFKLVRLKLRRFYEENLHNNFNVSISLDKKDFNTVITSKKILLNPSQKFIYWKDYMVNYLEKQREKGVQWAVDLIE